MSLATFRKAISMDAIITLGGGEPTLHRYFDTILLESLAVSKMNGEGSLFIITNGSITRRALTLAHLAKTTVLSAQLSQDEYHDEIDPRVVEAFENIGEDFNTNEGVRNTTQYRDPHPHGRALELLDLDPNDIIHRNGHDCMCEDLFVKPNGNIMQCGCDDSPLVGNVNDGANSPAFGECCHSLSFRTKVEHPDS